VDRQLKSHLNLETKRQENEVSSRRRIAVTAAIALVAASVLAACGSSSSSDSSGGAFQPKQPVELIVPFTAGGGVDLAGRTIARVLQEDKIVKGKIDVQNIDGGNGLVGMARVKGNKGADNQLMVTGAHIVATPLLTPGSGVKYSDFTPLATVYTEYVYFFVKADSEIKDISDVAARLKSDPGSVTIGGAVTGGASNLAVVKFAKSIGVDPKKLTYVPYDGDDALTALLGGKVMVGSGGPEGMDLVKAGKLRAIAVSSPEPINGVDGNPLPTWKDAGSDADFLNFRIVTGPPGMSNEAIKYWQDALTKMSKSDNWAKAVQAGGWYPFVKTDGLEDFLSQQSSDYEEMLKLTGVNNG
jgi:putative tricarboxylic transport membrane protein